MAHSRPAPRETGCSPRTTNLAGYPRALEHHNKVSSPRKTPDRPLHWLGKYLSLALTLPASVAAGYILGTVADHWLRIPILRAVGVLLGMTAGVIQVMRELARDEAKH